MKKSTRVLVACLSVIFFASPVQAQTATINEALTVANNWITLIIHEKGDWGGVESAEVGEILEFRRGERIVGYFCDVDPKGYIVISLHKGLAPVKAYSAVNKLDPESEVGMADLLKGSMERILDKIKEAEAQGSLVDIIEVNYYQAWEELLGNTVVPGESGSNRSNPTGTITPEKGSVEGIAPESDSEDTNYQEGDVLLTSDWHQDPPYNNDCPSMGCSNSNGRAVVGCVATAGAQIMRYWNWPPYGVGTPYSDAYDWPNMLDIVTTFSPAAQQAAVAELSHEVGVAVGMNYGCSASSAYTYNMESVYENQYRYANCVKSNRSGLSAVNWFESMKYQFNHNRPVHYRIPGHSIVGDGWQEIGSTPTRQYHMNYGWWGPGDDIWYTLDALQGGDPDEEYMLIEILPYPYVHVTLTGGTYSRQSFPYRYIYADTSISSTTTFEGGQNFQFLPDVALKYTGSSGSARFRGSISYYSRLYARGDPTRGLRINYNSNAAIKLYQNGCIKFF